MTVAQLVFVSDKSEALKVAAKARDELLRLATILCLVSFALLAPILFFLLGRLDKIVLQAKSVVLGSASDNTTLLNSEVCQLAQNAQDAKNLAKTMTRETSPI